MNERRHNAIVNLILVTPTNCATIVMNDPQDAALKEVNIKTRSELKTTHNNLNGPCTNSPS